MEHGGGKMTVRLEAHQENNQTRLFVEIEDHGKGFDPDLVKKMPGLGLKSMRERIRLVNGTISFNTQLDKGTEVVAEIDCP